MNELIKNQYMPDYVSAPGETLEEVLELRGMSQTQLADRTGRPKKTINEIIKGKAAITAETAIQLERVLGIPASFWMAREQNYREAIARAKEEDVLDSQVDWLSNVPYRAMVNLGWVREHREKGAQLEEVLRFFGVASPTSWEGIWHAPPAFRKSPSFQSKPGAVAAWLRKGELEASELEAEPFDEQAFRMTLTRVRSLTREMPPEFATTVQTLCSASGVLVVFVPELPGTSVWGATRWVSPSRALMQLSLRYKTDDHLWFTFFHEAAHILLHGRKDIFIEDDVGERSDKEQEADAFARDWLIPMTQYRVFCRKGSFSCAAASRFAYEIGVAPGIVVGRLQHDGYLDRSHCNNLKKPVDWIIDSE